MSAKVDQFCDKLRLELNAIEGRIQSVKTGFQDLPAKTDKAVREKLDQAKAKLQTHKERVEKARVDLKAWGDQKMGEAKSAINEWKAKHEVRKLDARADRAEAYADAAIVLALASVDEAEAAVLEAVAARLDADAAK